MINRMQTVDLKLSQIASEELPVASSDLEKRPPLEALVSFYKRHDIAMAKAIASSYTKPACGPGCSYCCYYKVEAKALEVVAIAQYVSTRFSSETVSSILEQAKRNVAEAKNLTPAEHVTTNQKCPFLIENRCSIYPVRPSKCRNFHASESKGCKDSYEQPYNLYIPNSFIAEVFAAGNGMEQGFEQAAANAGIDPRMYDLNSAFVEAFENPKAAKRLNSGKKAFLTATVVQPQPG